MNSPNEKRCLILNDRCPHCLFYYFEVLNVTRIGNWLRYLLYCLKCKQEFVAEELSVLASKALLNPNFEDGFSQRGNSPEVVIANGWEPWDDPRTYWPGVVKRPESKGSVDHVYNGSWSQGQAHRMCLWRGGLLQKLSVIPGHWYEFSIMVRVSSPGGRLHARVGMNPWGAWPSHYAAVTGKEALTHEKWERVRVIAEAWNNEITTFTEVLVEFPVNFSGVWWDAATFKEIEFGALPEPEPDPGPGDDYLAGVLKNQSTIMENQIALMAELDKTIKRGDTITL